MTCLWELETKEVGYRALRMALYENFIVIFAVTMPASFVDSSFYLKESPNFCGLMGLPHVLSGNQ